MSRTIDVLFDMPTKTSSSEQWLMWHKALKKEFGPDKANHTFLEAWKKRGNDTANDEPLRLYLQKQGVKLSADWKDAAIDFAKNPFGMGDFIDAVQRNLMIVGIVLLVLFVGIVWRVLANPEGAISLASNFTPMGRAAKMMRK